MKKFFITAICVLAGVALLLFYKSKQPAPASENPPAQNSLAGGTSSPEPRRAAHPSTAPPATTGPTGGANASPQAPAPLQPVDLSARAGSSVPGTNAPVKLPPEALVRNLRRAVRQYGQMFGGDPVGNNQEITAELSGKNPKQINFLTGQDGMTVNGNGELVDEWGTPYFFHQLSATDMEVRSAGPDRRMWTSDDIMTR
jgi:hypothetical protein